MVEYFRCILTNAESHSKDMWTALDADSCYPLIGEEFEIDGEVWVMRYIEQMTLREFMASAPKHDGWLIY